MIVFERFIERGRFDIEKFFEAAGISSDEELRAYCATQNMTAPVKEYFTTPEPVSVPEVKKQKPPAVKSSPKTAAKPKTEEVVEEVEAKTPPKKAVRKPRTTRRKTTAKKTQDK